MYSEDVVGLAEEMGFNPALNCLRLMDVDWLSWLGGSVVERRSLTGELSLVCT